MSLPCSVLRGSRCCRLKCEPRLTGSPPSTPGRVLLSLCSLPVESLRGQNLGTRFSPFKLMLPPSSSAHHVDSCAPQSPDEAAQGFCARGLRRCGVGDSTELAARPPLSVGLTRLVTESSRNYSVSLETAPSFSGNDGGGTAVCPCSGCLHTHAAFLSASRSACPPVRWLLRAVSYSVFSTDILEKNEQRYQEPS